MTDLQEMVMELMQDFRARNRDCKPHRIIFYRDGVSEGQFEQVYLKCDKFALTVQPKFRCPLLGYGGGIECSASCL